MPVSSIPFEQRYRPPDPRRRKRERLTKTDRFVCGFMGGLLGFGLWVMQFMIWLMVLVKAAPKRPGKVPPVDPFDLLPPLHTSLYPAAALGLFGLIVGPERMMDVFEKVVRILGKCAEAMSRQPNNN
jgi:hypothetical protein